MDSRKQLIIVMTRAGGDEGRGPPGLARSDKTAGTMDLESQVSGETYLLENGQKFMIDERLI